MSVFDLYAEYYDLLYRDKDYAAETEYLIALISEALPAARSVLELGCGTGGHALEFAKRGFLVHGIDSSSAMIERALEHREHVPATLRELLEFQPGDVRSYRAGHTFDAVVCLFHVLSYQTTNADQDATFATARAHLEPGGVFVFDFWYGPAVLSDRPEHVIKRATGERVEVRREATPTMYVNDNCVNVRFDIDIASRDDDRSYHVTENHRMRYLFLPEIEHRLAAAGFTMSTAQAWMSSEPLSESSWYGCVIARAL